MSLTELRHDRRRRRSPQLDEALLALLALPSAQPVIARIAAAVPLDCPRRMDQVLLAASIAIAAKLRPANPYAKATL